MRIAQIAPLFEAVPPKLYGGTERVVYALTEELVAMGHEVTLFASGDSITSATLDPMRPQALRLDPSVKDWIASYMRMMELVRRHQGYTLVPELQGMTVMRALVRHGFSRDMADTLLADLRDAMGYFARHPRAAVCDETEAGSDPHGGVHPSKTEAPP